MSAVNRPGTHRYRNRVITEVVLVLGGISFFAGFIHREGILLLAGGGGLLLAALAISDSLISAVSPGALTGLQRIDRRTLIYSGAGMAAGLLAATGHNLFYGFSLFPRELTIIAVTSPLIGMTEELVFRGYLQGRTRMFGPVFSIFAAAASHAVYKFIVLKSLPADTGINFPRLVLFTFLFGLTAGSFRELSRSAIPAMTAHAVFDVLVYGSFTEMPVWVWS